MTLIFNRDSQPLKQSHPGFDQTAYLKKTVTKDAEKKPVFKINDMNHVSFRVPPIGVPHVNPADNSLIEMEVLPEKVGMFYLHIVIG